MDAPHPTRLSAANQERVDRLSEAMDTGLDLEGADGDVFAELMAEPSVCDHFWDGPSPQLIVTDIPQLDHPWEHYWDLRDFIVEDDEYIEGITRERRDEIGEGAEPTPAELLAARRGYVAWYIATDPHPDYGPWWGMVEVFDSAGRSLVFAEWRADGGLSLQSGWLGVFRTRQEAFAAILREKGYTDPAQVTE